jgi:CheY-like chemotaxis protein
MRESSILKTLVGVQILLVDQDPEARDLLSSVLAYCGAFVSAVATSRDALDHLRTERIDVVIADIGLTTEEDGYWLLREMGARVGRDIPVVAVVTGRDHGLERTMPAGFQGHLRKPVDPWEMCRMVAGLARKA